MSKKKKTPRKKSAKKAPANSALPSMDSLPPRQHLEKMMRDFAGGGGGASAVDQAQDIMYDAWEAATAKRRTALARKALMVSPDCADAYVLLAEETARSLEEAIALCQSGMEAGQRALGQKVFDEGEGHFWGILETRPYMRARANLAQFLWHAGQHYEAIAHYWDMLRLNPNDNQGIRDMLMPCLLELGRDDDAERLFKLYEDDGLAAWVYSRALLNFRAHGDSPVTTQSLATAIKMNKHVPSYLLGRKKIPRLLPDYYGLGDANEAITYAATNQLAWRATPGALEWLTSSETGSGELGMEANA